MEQNFNLNIFNNDNQELQPLMELVQQIMELSEDNLTDEGTEIISGMISGAFTPKMREDAIAAMLKSFEDQNLTRAQVQSYVNQSRKNIEQAIDDLEPSTHKRALLDAVFDFFYDVFEQTLEKYHSYVFELPIKLSTTAKEPTYAHDTDACADLYAFEDITLPAHSLANKVHTGIQIALPEGWVAKIAPRSSIGANTGLRLSNSIGIIDADYRGEIILLYDNHSDSDYTIHVGDRIAQMWIEPVYRFKVKPVDILPKTERGEGGFGSTGK